MRPGLFARCCGALLRLFGWRVKLVWPPVPKAVVIVYPHTSNRDFIADKRGNRPDKEGSIRFR